MRTGAYTVNKKREDLFKLYCLFKTVKTEWYRGPFASGEGIFYAIKTAELGIVTAEKHIL